MIYGLADVFASVRRYNDGLRIVDYDLVFIRFMIFCLL